LHEFRRIAAALGAVIVAITSLAACAGSHSSTLPALSDKAPSAVAKPRSASAPADLVAIDAGGGAAGSFAPDQDFSANSWTYTTTAAIDSSSLTNPAPQTVYQSEREGNSFSYTIPGLNAGTAYTVRLSFAELWWKAAGKRIFGVAINGTSALSNFDIFATAGGADKAVTESFTATAGTGGNIVISFTSLTDNAVVGAIEILAAGGATPAPTSTPTVAPTTAPTLPPAGSLAVDAGGAAAGSFIADTDHAPSSWAYATASQINTSLVSNPAPQAVYQSEREGSSITYTIPGLTPGATYAVRLDFAELWWTAAGKRVFNVSINSAKVLSNFDVFAAAGARFKAVAESFNAPATSTGTIVISLSAVTDNAAINGIEITPGAAAATPIPTSIPTPITTPTATPTTAPTGPATAFVDWPTYAFDSQRSGFNPATTGITPASIAQLHVAWQASLNVTQTQPIVITNVAGHQALIVLASYNVAVAYDARSGQRVWQTTLPIQNVQDCGNSGISGTAQYDAALGAIFMAAGNGGGAPNHVLVYRLNAATGSVSGQVDVTPTLLAGEANYSHTGVLLADGRIYVGTGSDCEATPTGSYPSWRGRLVAIDPSSMTLLSTFFTTWQVGSNPNNYGGGGVWAWGAASADPSGNIYVDSGNAETVATISPRQAAAPFVPTTNEQAGYAENLVKLSGDLSTVEGANYPGFNFTIGWGDLDYVGTPVIYQPPGCDTLSATQGKGGTLVIHDTNSVTELNSFALSIPSASALYIGNPAYSPATGYLYAPINSAGNGSSMLAPGLAAIGGCGASLTWHAQFGPDSAAYASEGDNPRSAPTVTAGGVVFMGTPCTSNSSGGCGAAGAVNGALWAIDATTGSVLGGGKPVLVTGDNIRMAPSADGLWLWLVDDSGNLSALTVDPSVKAITAKIGARRPRSLRMHAR
jgi:hypothetical protein